MDELLPEEARDRLVATCRTTVGDDLRSITYFTRTDFQQVYLRDDLEQDADLMRLIGIERQDFNTTTDAYGDSELGEYRYTLRVFENGYLVRVVGENSAVFVTTDGMALRDFDALVHAVGATLEEWEG